MGRLIAGLGSRLEGEGAATHQRDLWLYYRQLSHDFMPTPRKPSMTGPAVDEDDEDQVMVEVGVDEVEVLEIIPPPGTPAPEATAQTTKRTKSTRSRQKIFVQGDHVMRPDKVSPAPLICLLTQRPSQCQRCSVLARDCFNEKGASAQKCLPCRIDKKACRSTRPTEPTPTATMAAPRPVITLVPTTITRRQTDVPPAPVFSAPLSLVAPVSALKRSTPDDDAMDEDVISGPLRKRSRDVLVGTGPRTTFKRSAPRTAIGRAARDKGDPILMRLDALLTSIRLGETGRAERRVEDIKEIYKGLSRV